MKSYYDTHPEPWPDSYIPPRWRFDWQIYRTFSLGIFISTTDVHLALGPLVFGFVKG